MNFSLASACHARTFPEPETHGGGYMKWQMLGMALICSSASSAAIAQAAPAQTPGARQEVLDTTKAWVIAENKHDAAALRRILDDKFISTFAANKPVGKATFIKAITKGQVDPTQSQSLTDESVVVDGDTAVIVGTDTFHSATNPPVAPLRFTITYVHKDGRWVALAEHIVAIPRRR